MSTATEAVRQLVAVLWRQEGHSQRGNSPNTAGVFQVCRLPGDRNRHCTKTPMQVTAAGKANSHFTGAQTK